MAGKSWSSQEVEFLFKHFPSADYAWMESQLSRTATSIQLKANRLGVVRLNWNWTAEQELYLTENYTKLSNTELANHLGFDTDRVQRKADQLKLRKGNRKVWNPGEDAKLRKILLSVPMVQLEEIFGTRRNSILSRASQLGLDYPISTPLPWTQEDEQVVQDRYGKLSYSEIGRLVGRDAQSVQNKAAKLGLLAAFGETTPERLVRAALESMQVSFIVGKEAQIRTGLRPGHVWKPDFFLSPRKVIEVHGDYFHCNPARYPDGPINEMQRKTVLKDDIKRRWLYDNGYELLEIWEAECQDFQSLVSSIEKFVSSRLELETAHK